MTTVISTSVQPSQPPQATGIAAATARNGTAMNSPSATCSLRDWVSPPSVALSGRSSSAGRELVAVAVALGGVMEVLTDRCYLRNRNLRIRRCTARKYPAAAPATPPGWAERPPHVAAPAMRRLLPHIPRLVCRRGPPHFECG